MVFGQVQQFCSSETDSCSQAEKRLWKEMMPGYLPSALLVKKDSFARVGFFEPTLKIAEWADWYARARAERLRERMLPDIVAYRRIHENNKGVRQRQYMYEYTRVIKSFIDRRRLKTVTSDTSGQHV